LPHSFQDENTFAPDVGDEFEASGTPSGCIALAVPNLLHWLCMSLNPIGHLQTDLSVLAAEIYATIRDASQ